MNSHRGNLLSPFLRQYLLKRAKKHRTYEVWMNSFLKSFIRQPQIKHIKDTSTENDTDYKKTIDFNTYYDIIKSASLVTYISVK